MAETLRPDIAAARSKMRVKLGGGREIKRLTEHLWEGEAVERMTTGSYGNGTGLIVLTDRRLLFVQDGVMWPYAFEWGERIRIRGGLGRLGQVTPPAWSSTRRR